MSTETDRQTDRRTDKSKSILKLCLSFFNICNVHFFILSINTMVCIYIEKIV